MSVLVIAVANITKRVRVMVDVIKVSDVALEMDLAFRPSRMATNKASL